MTAVVEEMSAYTWHVAVVLANNYGMKTEADKVDQCLSSQMNVLLSLLNFMLLSKYQHDVYARPRQDWCQKNARCFL